MWTETGKIAALMAQAQRGMLCLGLSALVFTAAACGDEEEPAKDKCAGVTCERGVCEAGACVNADACAGDAAKCLEGYVCAANGQCSATVACDPTDAASCAR